VPGVDRSRGLVDRHGDQHGSGVGLRVFVVNDREVVVVSPDDAVPLLDLGDRSQEESIGERDNRGFVADPVPVVPRSTAKRRCQRRPSIQLKQAAAVFPLPTSARHERTMEAC
jgi:hypothetical protein